MTILADCAHFSKPSFKIVILIGTGGYTLVGKTFTLHINQYSVPTCMSKFEKCDDIVLKFCGGEKIL